MPTPNGLLSTLPLPFVRAEKGLRPPDIDHPRAETSDPRRAMILSRTAKIYGCDPPRKPERPDLEQLTTGLKTDF